MASLNSLTVFSGRSPASTGWSPSHSLSTKLFSRGLLGLSGGGGGGGFLAISSIFFLKLRGLMSVQTSLIKARQSALGPAFPTLFHPSWFSLYSGHIEYCSS